VENADKVEQDGVIHVFFFFYLTLFKLTNYMHYTFVDNFLT